MGGSCARRHSARHPLSVEQSCGAETNSLILQMRKLSLAKSTATVEPEFATELLWPSPPTGKKSASGTPRTLLLGNKDAPLDSPAITGAVLASRRLGQAGSSQGVKKGDNLAPSRPPG